MAAMNDELNAEAWVFHRWSLWVDFTPWAFVSALMWVPGGTAGVYAIRRAGLAISVGIWSCVIVLLSFIWGVFIFGETQKSTSGALGAVAVLCFGLFGISYYSSIEVEIKKKGQATKQVEDPIIMCEATPLLLQNTTKEALDLELFPHCGASPHCHETIDIHVPDIVTAPEHTVHISKYHVGLIMAIVNGVLAATIMVPLHYAPPNSTRGVGYSMSFGIAAVLVVLLFWLLRYLFVSLNICLCDSRWRGQVNEHRLIVALKILSESLDKGYKQLPSFHIREMWKAGLTSGVL